MRRTFTTLLAAGALFAGATLPAVAGPPERDNTIVDIAVAVNSDGPFAGSFDTLIAAVTCTDAAALLSGNRQFTVFAPTDTAFAELGLDATNVCDLDEATLTSILLYHVAPGERFADDVVTSDRMPTMLRTPAPAFLDIDGATVNGENIIVTDVDASNGVIHAIDGVLLPS